MTAVNLPKSHYPISNHEINIIKQAQKPILFHNGYLWTKRSKPEFNIATGAFHSAEAGELFGILLLWKPRLIFNIQDTKLYRDDGIILLQKTSQQNIDRLRKDLIKLL